MNSNLSAPFTREEIRAALFGMNVQSSPGPDGFGPSFYRTFWSVVETDVLELFSSFYNGELDLDGLNRAFLVLLPKKEGARTADAYRPISLKNCPMKLFTRSLTNRLQTQIPNLVTADQTGFLKGQCISENSVYAAELLSCCHKRKVPTVVLKLDFRKAFDSVNWSSLDAILAARGFDHSWRGWVSSILSTGKTSILLNGVPGNWITCHNGLWQGDPLSPYLFIIVANVLQRMVRRASDLGLLVHPLDPSLPCPVLQYADDTLILLKGDLAAIQHLKSILDAFSAATGLHINFDKSTFVPMFLEDEEMAALASHLGCAISTFPQAYLGLPLSPPKLCISDFLPLVNNFDRYLSGW